MLRNFHSELKIERYKSILYFKNVGLTGLCILKPSQTEASVRIVLLVIDMWKSVQ